MSPNTLSVDGTAGEENPPVIPDLHLEAVIATAREQLGKPYRLTSEGPDEFDCSGLIWYIFRFNGLKELLGERRRARGYYRLYHGQGLIAKSVSMAQRGDLIFYGWVDEDNGTIIENNVTHIGIYLGGRRRRVISAIHNPLGVTRHGYQALMQTDGIRLPVVGFGKVQWPISVE